MKQAGLYHSLISPSSVTEPPAQEEDAGRYQLRLQWLESTMTQEHLAALNEKIQHGMLECLQLAKMFPVPHEQILKGLTQVNSFIAVRDMYNNQPNKQKDDYAS